MRIDFPSVPRQRHEKQDMQMVVRLLLLSILSFVLALHETTARAQQPVAPLFIDWPSPNGEFAFLTTRGEENTIDLIDKESGKKLQRIDASDISSVSWRLLWAPDSRRFALMTKVGHPNQGVDVYFRSGQEFQKVELPQLPEANIPDKLKHGKSFPHWASLNWQEAEKWKSDGSLVVTVVSMIDGEGSSIMATRTVVLGFDQAGKARIVKSTAIKYKTSKD
jgi:hypothetical protein